MTGSQSAAFARSKIGQGYIYGARGQTCTAAFRRQRAQQYPDQAQNILVTGDTWDGSIFTSSGDIVTVTSASENYIRVGMICTDASAVIATINEEIEQ